MAHEYKHSRERGAEPLDVHGKKTIVFPNAVQGPEILLIAQKIDAIFMLVQQKLSLTQAGPSCYDMVGR